MAGGRDVVLFALNRHHGHALNRGQIDGLARHDKHVARDFAVFENALDGRQVEFRRHIHHGKILIVKAVVGIVIGSLPPHHAHHLFAKSFRMTLGVHRHKARQLQQAWVNQSARALVLKAYALNGRLLQLTHRHTATKVGDIGRRCIRVNRPADQR